MKIRKEITLYAELHEQHCEDDLFQMSFLLV